MATYPKILKTLEIHKLLGDDEPVVVADTADDAKASMVLAQFEQYNDLAWEDIIEGDPVTWVIPYHAVQYIKVTKTVEQVEKAEAYDCERSCCE